MREQRDRTLSAELSSLFFSGPELSYAEAVAVCAHAAVQITAQGRFREEDCRAALRLASGQLSHTPLQALVHMYERLVALDKTPLIDFVAVLDHLLPGNIMMDRRQGADANRFFRDAEIQFANSGQLEGFIRPQPAVEAWVGAAAAIMLEEVAATLPMQSGRGALVADVCAAATLVLVHGLQSVEQQLGEVAKDARNEQCFSYAIRALWEVETSIYGALLIEVLRKLSPTEQQKFYERAEKLATTRVKLYAAGATPTALLSELDVFKVVRAHFLTAAWHALEFRKLEALPALAAQQAFLAAAVSAGGPRPLPVGEVVIAYSDPSGLVFTKYDGRFGLVQSAIQTGGDAFKMPLSYVDPKTAATRSGSVAGLLGASLDENGKIFATAAERHMPAPRQFEWYNASADALQRIASFTDVILKETWELHPGLFSALHNALPITIIATPEFRVIVAQQGFAPIQHLETAELDGAHTLAEWLYRDGYEVRVLEEMPAVEEPPAPLASERELTAWQRIYGSLPGGRLSYDWLLEQLKPFGVTEDRKGGKGSHYKLLRAANGGTKSYPVSQAFRKNLRNANELKDVLEGLGLSLEEFAGRA